MNSLIGAMVLVATLQSTAGAQAGAGPDSLAARARALYREAMRAADGGNDRQALDLMVKAHQSWPAQVGYLTSAVRLSARVADTAAVVRWLGAIADLGLSFPVQSLAEFADLSKVPALTKTLRRLEENGAPLGQSTPIHTNLPADFYPEGIDYDPAGNRWLVASVRQRTIASVDQGGESTPFVAPGGPALDAVLGVRVDPKRNLVWATTRVLPQQQGYATGSAPTTGVAVFDRRSGLELARAFVPKDSTSHWLGDLVVDATGTVYLSDSESPVVYRATYVAGKIALEEFVRHRFFRSLQGLAIDPTRHRLYLADYSHGLLSVDLTDRTVRYLPAPAGATTLGIDGLAWHQGDLIGVQNGVAPARVIRIGLAPSGDAIRSVTALDRQLRLADEPTIGTIVGGRFVYVANSQWEKYDDNGKLRDGAVLVPPILLSVPIGASRP